MLYNPRILFRDYGGSFFSVVEEDHTADHLHEEGIIADLAAALLSSDYILYRQQHRILYIINM